MMHINRSIFVHQLGALMAHTNIDLDEKLLAEAMELTRARTKKEVIHLGLRELVRLARLRAVREHRGKFHWRGDLRKMREEETHEWRKPPGRHKRSH
jgi:Arc/MetJ family transcription regulator